MVLGYRGIIVSAINVSGAEKEEKADKVGLSCK
jgi:hypothetical protein